MLKAISLFTGTGGLDFGFEAAGFETAVAVELDAACCRTLRLNRSWPVIERDIHHVTSKELLKVAGLKKGQADVLIGGPPCQPFSKSGYWARGDAARLKDSRADTLTAYLRFVRETQPKALLLENVYGLAYKGKDEGLERILEGLRKINREVGTNYRPFWQVIDAASYGVPQHRERVFIVASRDGRAFEFPAATHGNVEDLFFRTKPEPYRTAWDALGDLPEDPNDPALKTTGKWADLLPSIPEGQNYLWHTPRGNGRPLFGWRTRYWSFLLKLAKDRPSWTLQAQPGPATGPFHWRNRKLSAQEMCRLQTFPDGLSFDCARAEIQKMLGNAVPSLVAEVLAREIRTQLLDTPIRTKKLKLLPPRRKTTPKAERVAAVPRKYLPLEGEHTAHPGTGQGNRARARRVA
ncbi:DNA cytosine methyltransferase [uncultured Hyphomicrobium sp.]|uniref:DNA cytosine methyltransferase n=1 Tax=uncultured Hyphomicrobium sp. TaxID=194373 RepID=UPI0025D4029E|nr:DNA cytosine methyltransferase [uncultured Hyphomicrobium sp.]